MRLPTSLPARLPTRLFAQGVHHGAFEKLQELVLPSLPHADVFQKLPRCADERQSVPAPLS